MPERSSSSKIARGAALALLGALGLHFLIQRIGYNELLVFLAKLGPRFGLVVLAFIPHFALTTWALWVLLPEQGRPTGARGFVRLSAINLVAFAWNNIGPVTKSMGEVGRVLLLKRLIPGKAAVRAVVFFNLTQTLGTLLAFGLGGLAAPFFFSLSNLLWGFCALAVGVSIVANLLVYFWVKRSGRKTPRSRGKKFRSFRHWLHWTAHQTKKFYRTSPLAFKQSVALCTSARFAEAAVLYAAFACLGEPLSFLEATTLEIGRGIADNLFFFMPYQIGTRELSILYVAQEIIHKGAAAALTAALAFRLGELIWIFAGLLLAPLLERLNEPSPAERP